MKKRSFYLFFILTTFLLYACTPAQSDDNLSRSAPICMVNLDDGMLGIDTTYTPKDGKGIKVGLVWDTIADAKEYIVTINPGKQRYVVEASKTSLLASTNMKLNEPFSASLSVQTNNGATCGPIVYKSTYCNGGGTVDDVYRIVDWDNICRNSTCDFLRFRSRKIEDCSGNLLDPLPKRLRGSTYYKRVDVCDCLTDNGAMTICDGVKKLKLNPCLEKLEKCLKHDYKSCGE